MTQELEQEDYLLRILVERMQRDGSSEAAIEDAVRETAVRKRRELCRHSPLPE
jgi:hypothetical protein